MQFRVIYKDTNKQYKSNKIWLLKFDLEKFKEYNKRIRIIRTTVKCE